MKNPLTPLGMEPMTFQLVAQRLNRPLRTQETIMSQYSICINL